MMLQFKKRFIFVIASILVLQEIFFINAGNKVKIFAEQATALVKYYGDINKDGKVDTIDEQMLIKIVNGISSVTNDIKERCDLNGDGKITTQDVELIQKYNEESIDYFPVEPVFYGDMDLNGKITVSDLSAMIDAQTNQLLDTNKKIRADLNGDGNIDREDVNLITNYLSGAIKYFPVQNMLKSIQIKTKPAKLQYNIRENLNTSGMIIEAYYNNGYHRTVTNWTVYGGTNTAGNAQITVSYIEGTVLKTASYTINVKDITLKVNPTSLTADSKGNLSQDYISVDTNNTGNYHIFSNSSWLKVGTGSSKYNAKMNLNSISNDNFYVFADENTSTSSRTGTLKITHASDSTKSETITVTQTGRSNQLTVNPVNITADSEGTLSQSYIEVSTNNTGSYNVTSNHSWLTVGIGNSKNSSKVDLKNINSNRFYIFVNENTNTSDRSGTITVTHTSDATQKQIVTLTQKGKQAENNIDNKQDDIILKKELKVSPEKLDSDVFGKFKDNQNKVTVTLDSSDSVNVDTGSVSWLKISKNNIVASAGNRISFQGSADFYVFASENSSTTSREGDIKITVKNRNGDEIATKTVKVTQSEAKGELKTDITKITANAKGSLSIASVKVNTNNSGGFTVDTSDPSWIKVASENSEDGASSHISFTKDGTFYVFVSENNESGARKGTITIQHENELLKKEITVSQEGLIPVLTVDSTKKIAGQDGSFEQNKITVKTEKTGGFTVTVKDGDWLRVSKSVSSDFYDGMTELSFAEDAVFYLMASKNTGSERSATLTISHHAGTMEKTVEVVQTGAGDSYLRVDRETAYFDDSQAAADAVRVKVTADEFTIWTATTSDSWIELTPNLSLTKYRSIEGTGNGEFYIHVKENGTYEEREGTVIVSAPGQEDYEIYVHQVENEVDLVALLGELTVRVPRKTFDIKKSTRVILDYPEGLYASDIADVSYKSNKTKVATVNEKGIIKGKKKGKAVISVKVRLEEENVTKTFKIKINVGKRKVKIEKIKGN